MESIPEARAGSDDQIGCAQPIGQDNDGNTIFCGRAVKDGSEYCSRHLQ